MLRQELSDEVVSDCASHPKPYARHRYLHTLKKVIKILLRIPGPRVKSLSLDMDQDLIQI